MRGHHLVEAPGSGLEEMETPTEVAGESDAAQRSWVYCIVSGVVRGMKGAGVVGGVSISACGGLERVQIRSRERYTTRAAEESAITHGLAVAFSALPQEVRVVIADCKLKTMTCEGVEMDQKGDRWQIDVSQAGGGASPCAKVSPGRLKQIIFSFRGEGEGISHSDTVGIMRSGIAWEVRVREDVGPGKGKDVLRS